MIITRMREERIKRKWTQAHLGMLIGITKTAVHDIEVGRRKPSYEVMVKLENLFGLSHRQLFAVVDEKETHK